MQIKGRVACEINSGDELVATELIFAGAAQNPDLRALTRLPLFYRDPTHFLMKACPEASLAAS